MWGSWPFFVFRVLSIRMSNPFLGTFVLDYHWVIHSRDEFSTRPGNTCNTYILKIHFPKDTLNMFFFNASPGFKQNCLFSFNRAVNFRLGVYHHNKWTKHNKTTPQDDYRWWFQIFFGYFHPYLGKKITHFDEHIFQRGWFNHQLVRMMFDVFPSLPPKPHLQRCSWPVDNFPKQSGESMGRAPPEEPNFPYDFQQKCLGLLVTGIIKVHPGLGKNHVQLQMYGKFEEMFFFFSTLFGLVI